MRHAPVEQLVVLEDVGSAAPAAYAEALAFLAAALRTPLHLLGLVLFDTRSGRDALLMLANPEEARTLLALHEVWIEDAPCRVSSAQERKVLEFHALPSAPVQSILSELVDVDSCSISRDKGQTICSLQFSSASSAWAALDALRGPLKDRVLWARLGPSLFVFSLFIVVNPLSFPSEEAARVPRVRHLTLESYLLISSALRQAKYDIDLAAASLHVSPRQLTRQMLALIRSDPLFGFPDLPEDFKFYTSFTGISRAEMRDLVEVREKRRAKRIAEKQSRAEAKKAEAELTTPQEEGRTEQ